MAQGKGEWEAAEPKGNGTKSWDGSEKFAKESSRRDRENAIVLLGAGSVWLSVWDERLWCHERVDGRAAKAWIGADQLKEKRANSHSNLNHDLNHDPNKPYI